MFHFCKEHVHIFHRGFKHFLVFTFPCEKTKNKNMITWSHVHGILHMGKWTYFTRVKHGFGTLSWCENVWYDALFSVRVIQFTHFIHETYLYHRLLSPNCHQNQSPFVEQTMAVNFLTPWVEDQHCQEDFLSVIVVHVKECPPLTWDTCPSVHPSQCQHEIQSW